MARGIESIDDVASPTFTINRNYRAKNSNLVIEHYDFYRIGKAGILKAEIEESLNEKDSVVVIEWAEIVSGVLPEERLKILIEVGEEEDSREFSFTASNNHTHLLEGLRL